MNNKKRANVIWAILICTVSLLLGSSSGFSKKLSVEDLKKIQSKLKQREFMTSDFKQDHYVASRRGLHKFSTGILHLKRPQSFRWVLLKPKASEVIYDGSNLYIYDPPTKKADQYGGAGKGGLGIQRIVDMVMSLDSLLSHYKLKNIEQTGDLVLIEMIPKKSRDMVSANLTLNLKKNYIAQLKMFFRSGNHTTISFKSPRKSKLATGIFKLPKGVDVKKIL